MNLHLNYDGKQNNGIIFNATYSGAMFNGVEFRPVLSFEYDSFMYSEVFDGQPNYVIQNDGIRRLMTQAEVDEIIPIATNWVQPLGQEGNPNAEQQKVIDKQQALSDYEKAIEAMIGKVPNTELSSWSKQETEARNLDKPTPMIDQLIISRGQSETREQLAAKIIANADAYAVGYAQVLGEYQAKLKLLV